MKTRRYPAHMYPESIVETDVNDTGSYTRIVEIMDRYTINIRKATRNEVQNILSSSRRITPPISDVIHYIQYGPFNGYYKNELCSIINKRILSYIHYTSHNNIKIITTKKNINDAIKLLHNNDDEVLTFEQKLHQNGSGLLKLKVDGLKNMKNVELFCNAALGIRVDEGRFVRFYIDATIQTISCNRYIPPTSSNTTVSVTITFTGQKDNNNKPPLQTECIKRLLSNQQLDKVHTITRLYAKIIHPKLIRIRNALNQKVDRIWLRKIKNTDKIGVLCEHINQILKPERIQVFINFMAWKFAQKIVQNSAKILMNDKLKDLLKPDQYIQFSGGAYHEFRIYMSATVGIWKFKKMVFKTIMKVPTCWHYLQSDIYHQPSIQNVCLSTNSIDEYDIFYVMYDLV